MIEHILKNGSLYTTKSYIREIILSYIAKVIYKDFKLHFEIESG